MTTTYFVCPHCGSQAQSDMPVLAVDFDNGCPLSYFPVEDLTSGRERHIDTRLCCEDCWKRAGKVPAQVGAPHPYSGTCHEQRLAAPVGAVVGSPVVYVKE